MKNRHDFSEKIKLELAKRAGWRCSFPCCGVSTAGPKEGDPEKGQCIGVASHICAASPGGPRYDLEMNKEERCSINNGIWMCRNHGTQIDNDDKNYSKTQLLEWKKIAEETAHANMGKINDNLLTLPSLLEALAFLKESILNYRAPFFDKDWEKHFQKIVENHRRTIEQIIKYDPLEKQYIRKTYNEEIYNKVILTIDRAHHVLKVNDYNISKLTIDRQKIICSAAATVVLGGGADEATLDEFSVLIENCFSNITNKLGII